MSRYDFVREPMGHCLFQDFATRSLKIAEETPGLNLTEVIGTASHKLLPSQHCGVDAYHKKIEIEL